MKNFMYFMYCFRMMVSFCAMGFGFILLVFFAPGFKDIEKSAVLVLLSILLMAGGWIIMQDSKKEF